MPVHEERRAELCVATRLGLWNAMRLWARTPAVRCADVPVRSREGVGGRVGKLRHTGAVIAAAGEDARSPVLGSTVSRIALGTGTSPEPLECLRYGAEQLTRRWNAKLLRLVLRTQPRSGRKPDG